MVNIVNIVLGKLGVCVIGRMLDRRIRGMLDMEKGSYGEYD